MKNKKRGNALGIHVEEGVFFDDSVGDAGKKQNIFDLLMKFLLIYAGCIGMTGCLEESYQLLDEQEVLMAVFVPVIVVLMTLTMINRKNARKLEIGIVLVLGMFIYGKWDFVKSIAAYGYSSIAESYNSYYGWSLPLFEPEYDAAACGTVALVILILPVCGFLAKAVGRSPRIRYAVLACLPYLLMMFSSGHMPSAWCMGLVLGSFLGIYSMNRVAFCGSFRIPVHAESEKKQGMQGTAALCMILMILISAYLGYGLFYPKVEEVLGPVRYAVYHSSFKELYEQLRGGYKSGGINGGKLGRGGKLKFNYRAHLVVYSEQDVNQYTYLKGYAGDVYTGDEWVALDSDLYQALYEEADADQEDLMSLPYSVVNALKNETLYGYALSQFTTMRIYIRLPDETVGDGSYVCLPYGGLISQADGTLMDLNYVARADQSNLENVYDSYYCQTTGGWTGEGLEELVSTLSDVKAFTDIEPLILENDELLEKAWSQEQVYREFVYANDLDVPDRVSRLREEYSGKTFGNLSQAIAFVQNEVAKGATYTLEPENCPYGSDFIENFMYEDKEGYCTYFASAAVMIFRCLGIPARFVQGYLVPPLTANEEVTVDDSYAHAWAEIYVDNFGWIPVEVTPGLGGLPGGFTPEMNREGGNASYTEESTTEAPTTTEEPTTEESTTEESTTEEQITTDEPEEEPTLPQLTDSDETSSEEEPTQESAGIEQEVTASDTEDLRTSKKTKPAPEGSTGEGKTGTDAGTDAEVGNQSHAIFLAVLAVIKTLGIIFAVILALTGGLYVHHRSRCAARRRRFRQKSNRNSTLAMYHELCKMSGHYHVPMDETTAPHELSLAYPVDEQTWQAVQALVREAAFSDHEITEEQKSLMLGVYNQCCRHVDSKLKFIKKMMFRIWDGYR